MARARARLPSLSLYRSRFFFEVEGRYRRSEGEIRSALPRCLHWCLPMAGYLWTHFSYYYLGVGFLFIGLAEDNARLVKRPGIFGHVMCALAFLFPGGCSSRA